MNKAFGPRIQRERRQLLEAKPVIRVHWSELKNTYTLIEWEGFTPYDQLPLRDIG
jgi:hypothetical protein